MGSSDFHVTWSMPKSASKYSLSHFDAQNTREMSPLFKIESFCLLKFLSLSRREQPKEHLIEILNLYTI